MTRLPAPAPRPEDARWVLDVDVPTPVGVFSSGLPVQIVGQSGTQLLVCLDAGHVDGTRCHAELLPLTAVRFAPGPPRQEAA